MEAPTLRTDRLIMRPWRDADRVPFAALNADPVVMEHFPSTLDRRASDAFVDRVLDGWDRSGWGLWAIEVIDGEPFIGYVGLWPGDHVEAGLVEVGWRLARPAWGRGHAPEAATEALRFGFTEIGLAEIASFTSVDNTRSRRVMEKIGLRHQPERDFDNTKVDAEVAPHLVRHVFYGVEADEWLASDDRRQVTQAPRIRGSTAPS